MEPGELLHTATKQSATSLVGATLHAQEFYGLETKYIVDLSQLGLNPTGDKQEAGVSMPVRLEPAAE